MSSVKKDLQNIQVKIKANGSGNGDENSNIQNKNGFKIERPKNNTKLQILKANKSKITDSNQNIANAEDMNNNQVVEAQNQIEKGKKGEKKCKKIMKKIIRSLSNPSKKVQFKNDEHTESVLKKAKSYNIKIQIENEPICIAIGDIEGNINKLKQICKFININQNLDFVFIGDLFNDISDLKGNDENWECISMICDEFLQDDDNIIFKSDDEEINDKKYKNKKVISLPSGFSNIQFNEKKYNEIKNRVKFIAGNSECDCLSDILKGCQSKINKYYIFGEGQYKKTISFEKMCILYRYLSNCHGVITLKKYQNIENIQNYKETVYFRHSIKKFDDNRFSFDILKQNTSITSDDIRKQNFIFVSGHSRLFASAGPREIPNQEMFYFIDTSRYIDTNNKTPNEIKGLGDKDFRMALITLDEFTGFCVDCIALPSKFAKSPFKFGLNQIE